MENKKLGLGEIGIKFVELSDGSVEVHSIVWGSSVARLSENGVGDLMLYLTGEDVFNFSASEVRAMAEKLEWMRDRK